VRRGGGYGLRAHCCTRHAAGPPCGLASSSPAPPAPRPRRPPAPPRSGIESCGILAGTLSPDDSIFRVTTLIIPKQEGTSDTVAALNEEDIYEAQASR
jgi:hypothetical protein